MFQANALAKQELGKAPKKSEDTWGGGGSVGHRVVIFLKDSEK